jgi:hypothetical protein
MRAAFSSGARLTAETNWRVLTCLVAYAAADRGIP